MLLGVFGFYDEAVAETCARNDCGDHAALSLLQTSLELHTPRHVTRASSTETAHGEPRLHIIALWLPARPAVVAGVAVMVLLAIVAVAGRGTFGNWLPDWHPPTVNMSDQVFPVGLAALYIAWAFALVFANKYLAGESVFPYPVTLTAMHMLASALAVHGVLFGMSKFAHQQAVESNPSASHATTSLPWIDSAAHMEHVRAAGPEACKGLGLTVFILAVLLTSVLVTENRALHFCSVAFLQLLKDMGVITVALCSVLARVDVLSYTRWGLCILVVTGGCLCIKGEVSFVLAGFLLQLSSTLINSVKVVMMNVLLWDEALKLDPLSYSAMVTPACVIVLFPFVLLEISLASSSVLDAFQAHHVVILANIFMAGAMNVILAFVMKQFGAIGAALLATLKNGVILVVSFAMLGVPTTGLQLLGAALIFISCPAYAMVKKSETSGSKS